MSMHTPILSRLPLNRLVPFWLVWFQVKSIASSLAGSIPVWPVGSSCLVRRALCVYVCTYVNVCVYVCIYARS